MENHAAALQVIDFDALSYPLSFKGAAKILRAATKSSDISLGALHAICTEVGWLKRGRHLEVQETEEGKHNGVTVVDRVAYLSRTGLTRLVAFFPATFWQ